MKKTTLYLSFLLCFVAISVLTSCGGGSGDENAQSRETNKSISKKVGTSGGEVKLEDTSTSISLDIPGDALSEEANITITHLKGAAVHDSLKEFSNREGGVVFEFGPDGLVFDKPVPFTVKLGEIDGSTQLGQMQLPVVAAISVTSDGTVSSLSDLELVYDGETDGVSLTGTLSHFSKIEIRIIKNLLVTAEGVPETPIAPGTHFNVNVKLPGKDKLKNSDKVSTYYFDESEPQVLYHSVAPNDQFEWNNFDYSCQTDEGIYSAVVTMRLQEGEPFWQVKDGNSHFNIEREFVGEPKIRFEKRVSCPPDLPKVAINVLSDPPIKESDSAVIELVADQAYDEPLQFDVSAFGSAKYGLDWHFGGSDVNLFVEKLDKEFSFDDSDGNYYDTEKAFIYDPMRGGVIDTETGEVVQYKEPLNHTFRFKLGAGQTKLTLGLHGIDNFVLDGDKVLGLFISSVQAALSSSPLNSFLWPDDLGDGSGTAVLGARGTLLTVVPNEVSGVINEPFQIALEQTFSAFGDGTSTASSNVILYIEDPNGVLSAPSLDAPREGDGASASLNNTNRQLFESQVSYLSLD
ncbi:MAG: hypothetical protein OEX00_03570, partial [Gammaproteobacteria bacterium]|nr:hypothetical protein [Gammaproteobacteria bacterium]